MCDEKKNEEEEIQKTISNQLGHTFYLANFMTIGLLICWPIKYFQKYGISLSAGVLSSSNNIFYLII
jgi:hypothetical protein